MLEPSASRIDEERNDPVGSPGWVFILSVERSGSTLLSGILAGHPNILAPPELHLLRRKGFDTWCRDFPLAMESLRTLWTQLGASEDPAERFAGGATARVYRAALARASGGTLLVDKTPGYAHDSAAIERTLALAPRYIWLVRHPLGVAHSQLSRPLRTRRVQSRRPSHQLRHRLNLLRRMIERVLGTEVHTEIRRWCEANERLEHFLAQQPRGRVHRLSYEALVRDPELQIARLTAFLDLAPVPEMFHPEVNLTQQLRWGIGNPGARDANGIEADRADRWRGILDPALLTPRAQALLERNGFEL